MIFCDCKSIYHKAMLLMYGTHSFNINVMLAKVSTETLKIQASSVHLAITRRKRSLLYQNITEFEILDTQYYG